MMDMVGKRSCTVGAPRGGIPQTKFGRGKTLHGQKKEVRVMGGRDPEMGWAQGKSPPPRKGPQERGALCKKKEKPIHQGSESHNNKRPQRGKVSLGIGARAVALTHRKREKKKGCGK